jgi:hypothetical protein
MGKHAKPAEPCPVCKGDKVTEVSHDGSTIKVVCPTCKGTGLA